MSDVVPEGWKTYCLSEYSTSRGGTTYISSELSQDKERFPLYINMKSFKVNGGYNKDGDKFFTSKYSSKQLVKYNDILIANTDVTDNCDILGAPIYIPQEKLKNDILFSHHVSALNISQNIDILFLYYIFCTQKMRIEMKRIGRGTTVKMLDMKDVEKISFSFPPLPEQKKITSILTSVDEVIENTQKQIDKLQDLKKATMNKLLTEGIGHREFKDSELGKIPKNWEVLELGSIARINRGKFSHRPRNDPQFYGGNIPFLQTGDIPTEKMEINEYSQSLNANGLKVSRIFPRGTLVMSIAATIGEVGILNFDSCFPDSLVGMHSKSENIEIIFLFYLLKMNKENLIKLAPESAQKNLNLDILNPFLLKVPPLVEQKKIMSILLSLDNNLNNIQQKNQRYQSLKKSLMQDLLTGKIRVSVN